jgi:predicted RND superfamily exporter protein
MWNRLATYIIRNRFSLLIATGVWLILAFWQATNVKLTYDFAKVIPSDDPDFVSYTNFKETFGEDGNILAVGVKSEMLFEKDFFNHLLALNRDILAVDGVEKVISLSNIFIPIKNEDLRQLELKPIVEKFVQTDAEMDSIKNLILSLPIYKGILYNDSLDFALIAITLNKQKLDSKDRIGLVNSIEAKCIDFGKKQNAQMHYSGLPYVRTVYASKVADEIKVFTYLAILVTALFIFIFFKFYSAVIFSLIVVVIGVFSTLASIHLMGFRITLLTGLIPPLIVIIGIQNCIYLLNVYHQEFRTHGNKMLAIIRLISKNGLPLLLTNVTTAIGFVVFSFSGSALLDQFGIVAGLNILLIYVVSLLLIPIVYSYLPPPKVSHTKHLDNIRLKKVMKLCYHIVYNNRKVVYITTALLILVALGGATQIKTLGYVVDDLPQHNKVYKDLKYFEKELKGVLPYEIAINTNRKGGVKDLTTLQKMNRLQKELAAFPEFSKAISVVDFLKFANQGYNDGQEKYYILPAALDIPELINYLPANSNSENGLMKSLVDKDFQTARISIQMSDVGSTEMKAVNARVRELTKEIFPEDKFEITITGTSLIFLKGNDYLIKNLTQSMVAALIIISLMMAILFFSWKMVLISLVPNIVPLLLTLGIMGYFDIRLKPSTIIIFSVAYGIVVDFTIHYLAKYRNALKKHNWDMKIAIPDSLKDAGPSIIYTAVALFAGFIIFAASEFGGTVALGVLTSLALMFGMLMNLLLLPSMLLSLEKSLNKHELDNALVQLEPDPTDSDDDES